jgi:hypothetical protein
VNIVSPSKSILLRSIRIANVKHILRLAPWIFLFICSIAGFVSEINSNASHVNVKILAYSILFVIFSGIKIFAGIGSILQFITKGSLVIAYEMLSVYYEDPMNALDEIDEELSSVEKPLKKMIVTENYVITFSAIGVGKNFMPISVIEEITYESHNNKNDDNQIVAVAIDSFGNKMLIHKLEVSKKQPETLNVELHSMQEFVKTITNKNHNIKVQNMPVLKMDEKDDDVEESVNNKIFEKGNFHKDEQDHFIENGRHVDEYGRPVRA